MNSLLRSSLVLLLILITLLACCLAVDNPQNPAVVTFTLDFPQSIPDHYSFSVSADGHASYDSTGKLTPDSDPGDSFHEEFTLSADTCKRIFDLSTKAKYFEGDIDSGKRNLASTGAKVLTYSNGSQKTKAAYNYSPNPAVQQLTAIFQNMSTTMEFGRRLDYFHRHQKLALEDELKRMEQMSKEKSLGEVSAVASILQVIVADKSVLNVTRARAQRLLDASAAPR